MLKRISTLTLACCLGLLAAPAPSWACDGEKSACGSKATATKTVNASETCTSASKIVALGAKGDCSSPCGSAKTASKTVALGAKGDCSSPCGSAKTASKTVALGAKGDCSSSCGSAKTARKTVALDAKGVCSSSCGSAKTAGTVALGAKGDSSPACGSAKTPARYVAFGCTKTDRLARTAARSYVEVISAIKEYSGADGCAAQTASQVLASMLEDQPAERTAAAPASGDAVAVSFGVVGDGQPACSGSKTAKTVAVGKKSTCSGEKAAKTVAVGKNSTCSGEKTAKTVAVGKNSTCSGEKAAKTVAVGKNSTCSGEKAAKTVAVGKNSTCGGEKATKTVAVGTKSTCSGEKATKTVAGSSTCSDSKAAARYVAFGCTKTDRLARTAARSYVEVMTAIKEYSGADGCAAQTATQVLTAMLEDAQAERTASAAPAGDTMPVSLGAVGDCSPGCCSKK